MRKSITWIIVFVVVCSVFSVCVSADDAVYSDSVIIPDGFNVPDNIYDGNVDTYSDSHLIPGITVSRDGGIASLYVVFDKLPGEWSLTCLGKNESNDQVYKTLTCGINGYLHEFIDLQELVEFEVTELKLAFTKTVSIAEIYAFSSGVLPEWVQNWQPTLDKADLLVIASHAGDENLCFAGVIPYYASERCVTVQVAYLVNYENTHDRIHEQLDTLWASGIRNYPVIGNFPDVSTAADDKNTARKEALSSLESEGFTFEDIVKFITLNIRHFRPLVVVSHDLNGEHNDGLHILCAEALVEASKKCGDYNEYTEDLAYNFTWTPEKIYLHLYGEGKITLDLDTKLGGLGMKTPFEVSSAAYRYHKSQLDTKLAQWLLGTEEDPVKKEADISSYPPSEYGLLYSSVGEDVIGGDLFENVIPYAKRDTHLDDDSLVFPDLIETETITEAPEIEVIEDTTVDEPDVESPVNRKAVTVIVVVVSVVICVLIVIFTAASSQTSVRSRRKKMQERRNKTN